MRAIFLLALAAATLHADDKSVLLQKMDSQAAHYGDVSHRIWEFAEVGYKENRSAALLESELRQAGFSLQENIAGIPTAFTANWGQGKPVIAILGEYDALPSLSQDVAPERKPLVANGPEHGCGHNLLGSASLFAAITIKDWLADKKMPGTIRYYGTPAEEGGGGKVYMARAGIFQDVDVVLTWHPSDANGASEMSTLAIIAAKFKFHGKPSHAAAAPELGRSALDGLMVMTTAIEFLREHVPESTRIHYIITNGGAAPNIVPEFAELYLYARNPSMPVLDGIWDRIVKCAQAGALATETTVDMELIDSAYNMLPNDAARRAGGQEYAARRRCQLYSRGAGLRRVDSQNAAAGARPVARRAGADSESHGRLHLRIDRRRRRELDAANGRVDDRNVRTWCSPA
jgi:aminobenzoyl-glutamate utilization protein B